MYKWLGLYYLFSPGEGGVAEISPLVIAPSSPIGPGFYEQLCVCVCVCVYARDICSCFVRIALQTSHIAPPPRWCWPRRRQPSRKPPPFPRSTPPRPSWTFPSSSSYLLPILFFFIHSASAGGGRNQKGTGWRHGEREARKGGWAGLGDGGRGGIGGQPSLLRWGWTAGGPSDLLAGNVGTP